MSTAAVGVAQVNPFGTGMAHPTPPAKPLRKKRDAVRIGLCGVGRAGAGMVTRDVVPVSEATIVAVCDLVLERAEQFSSLHGGRVLPDFKSLLNDPDVEVVVIATRSHEHVPLAIQALKSGKHVLVEKPMAMDLAGADRLLKQAKLSSGRLFVRHNRRFDPMLLVAKEIIQSGKIGNVFEVKISIAGYQRRADWQTMRKFGGGQLLNWGPHCVDWAMQLIGPKAVDVWADLKRVCAAGDAEDHVKLLIRGETGIVADVEISGGQAMGKSSWTIHGQYGGFTIEAGRVRLKYLHKETLKKLRADENTPSGYDTGEKLDWTEEEFDCVPKHTPRFWTLVYKTLRDGDEFPITHAEARENMRVLELARRIGKLD